MPFGTNMAHTKLVSGMPYRHVHACGKRKSTRTKPAFKFISWYTIRGCKDDPVALGEKKFH